MGCRSGQRVSGGVRACRFGCGLDIKFRGGVLGGVRSCDIVATVRLLHHFLFVEFFVRIGCVGPVPDSSRKMKKTASHETPAVCTEFVPIRYPSSCEMVTPFEALGFSSPSRRASVSLEAREQENFARFRAAPNQGRKHDKCIEIAHYELVSMLRIVGP